MFQVMVGDLTEEVIEKLQAQASRRGISLDTHLRTILTEAAGAASADLLDREEMVELLTQMRYLNTPSAEDPDAADTPAKDEPAGLAAGEAPGPSPLRE